MLAVLSRDYVHRWRQPHAYHPSVFKADDICPVRIVLALDLLKFLIMTGLVLVIWKVFGGHGILLGNGIAWLPFSPRKVKP